jgi:hypothetical protein
MFLILATLSGKVACSLDLCVPESSFPSSWLNHLSLHAVSLFFILQLNEETPHKPTVFLTSPTSLLPYLGTYIRFIYFLLLFECFIHVYVYALCTCLVPWKPEEQASGPVEFGLQTVVGARNEIPVLCKNKFFESLSCFFSPLKIYLKELLSYFLWVVLSIIWVSLTQEASIWSHTEHSPTQGADLQHRTVDILWISTTLEISDWDIF